MTKDINHDTQKLIEFSVNTAIKSWGKISDTELPAFTQRVRNIFDLITKEI